jgi:hypothetical protein
MFCFSLNIFRRALEFILVGDIEAPLVLVFLATTFILSIQLTVTDLTGVDKIKELEEDATTSVRVVVGPSTGQGALLVLIQDIGDESRHGGDVVLIHVSAPAGLVAHPVLFVPEICVFRTWSRRTLLTLDRELGGVISGIVVV